MSPFATFFEELGRIEQAANCFATGMATGLAVLLSVILLI